MDLYHGYPLGCWGLTYGLGVRYLGVSLGSSIILGLCSIFGALIPSVYYDLFPEEGKDTITVLFSQRWGQMVLLGLLVCVIGIIICGKAGAMKDKDLAGKTKGANQEFKLGLGLLVAIISGVLSACFSFGLEAGTPMAKVANEAWKAAHPGEGEFLYRNNVIYVVLLWGGLTTNLIWCMILNARNKTFKDYNNKQAPLAKKLFILGAGWYYLVSAVLFLWHGRKQAGQWRQLVDIAHGLYHTHCQCLGPGAQRMERCEPPYKEYHHCRHPGYPGFRTYCRLW